MNYTFNFKNKNVVITGGAQGIGLQIATDFKEAGANVAIWDYSDAPELSKLFHVQKVDVSDFVSCERAAAALPFPVDILINNAGIVRDKSFAKMSHDEFESVVATNLNGVFNVTKNLFEKFNPASKQKRIINVSSIVAFNGNFGQTNYVSAKAGVIGMTKTLARELGRKGFTVNAIAPGFIKTAIVSKMPADVVAGMSERIPLGRPGEPKDIASVALFLASEAAQYINGSVINVDGGLVI